MSECKCCIILKLYFEDSILPAFCYLLRGKMSMFLVVHSTLMSQQVELGLGYHRHLEIKHDIKSGGQVDKG